MVLNITTFKDLKVVDQTFEYVFDRDGQQRKTTLYRGLRGWEPKHSEIELKRHRLFFFHDYKNPVVEVFKSFPSKVDGLNFFTVRPQPPLIFGLGFSQFSKDKVRVLAPNRYQFEVGPELFLIVEVDPKHKGEPLKLERQFRGKDLGTFRYLDYRPVSEGLRLPHKVLYSSEGYFRTYKILEGNLGPNSGSNLTMPLIAPGLKVIDKRVFPEVVWGPKRLSKAHSLGGELNPDDLYGLSRKVSDDLGKNRIEVDDKVFEADLKMKEAVDSIKAGGFFSCVLVPLSLLAIGQRRRPKR